MQNSFWIQIVSTRGLRNTSIKAGQVSKVSYKLLSRYPQPE